MNFIRVLGFCQMLDVIWGFAFVKSENVGCGRVYGGFLLGAKDLYTENVTA